MLRHVFPLALAVSLISCDGVTLPSPGSTYVLERIGERELPFTYLVFGGDQNAPTQRYSWIGGTIEFLSADSLRFYLVHQRTDSGGQGETTCPGRTHAYSLGAGGVIVVDGYGSEAQRTIRMTGRTLVWEQAWIGPPSGEARLQFREGEPRRWGCP